MIPKQDIPTLFGKPRGYVETRIATVISNYHAKSCSKEVALMNLKAHGKTEAEALELLGPEPGNIIASITPPAEENLTVEEPDRPKVKRGRGRWPARKNFPDDVRLP